MRNEINGNFNRGLVCPVQSSLISPWPTSRRGEAWPTAPSTAGDDRSKILAQDLHYSGAMSRLRSIFHYWPWHHPLQLRRMKCLSQSELPLPYSGREVDVIHRESASLERRHQQYGQIILHGSRVSGVIVHSEREIFICK